MDKIKKMEENTMRTKRFLSLVLAVAMLGTMAISASAAETSKIYLTDDFPESVYTNGNTLLAAGGMGSFNDAGKFTFKGFDVDGDPETSDTKTSDFRINGNSGAYWSKSGSYAGAYAVTPDRLRQLGISYYYTNWNSGGLWGFSTNSLGHNALYAKQGTGSFKSSFHCLYRILPERWLSEADEALVFTTEIEPIATTYTLTGTSFQMSTTGHLYYLQASTVVDGAATNIKTTGVSTAFAKTETVVDAEAGTKEISWTTKVGGVEVPQSDCGKVFNYTTVLSYKDDATLTRQNYVDGVALGSPVDVEGNAVESYDFMADRPWGYKAANAKLYSLSTAAGAFNVTRTSTGLVPTSATSIPVKFSQPVDAATYDADAVTITGVSDDKTTTLVNGKDFELTALTEVVEGSEIYSTTNIILNTELEEATDYTITFPAEICNTAAISLGAYNTINFSTPTPEVKLNAFDVIKGWGTDAEAVAEEFVADGSLQTAKLALENTTEEAKNVAVIYAVYGNNGQLKEVVYADDRIAALSETEITAGTTLTDEGTVKAFVWDGISSLKPYSKETVKTIAAAQ
ncbi:MAG: hypothetical protein IKW02_04055 [Clostridia bacterium]|nr:hypothetical protein [Clostridia bacterium]